MPFDPLEIYVRANVELWQYLVFFGLLGALALCETILQRGERPPQRKRRWLPNFSLTALNIVVLGAVPISALAAADLAAKLNFGLLNLPATLALEALIAGFLLRSLMSYGVHVAFHKIPFLWRFHRVHHSDAELDVSTTVRMHPGEFLITAPVIAGGVFLFGIPPLAIMLYEVFDAAIAVFSHANVRLPNRLSRFMQWLVVTPDIHRIHHSSHQPETDSNYGATLTIWDRLFGTLRTKSPEALSRMQLGLQECQDNRTSSLWWLLRLPFKPLEINRPSSEEEDQTDDSVQKHPAE